MRIFLGLVLACSGVSYGDSDIDHLKNNVLRPFYYGDGKKPGAIKEVEDHARDSYMTADNYIHSAYVVMETSFKEGLAESTANLKEAYDRADSCRAQMDLIYTLFKPYIEAESGLATRQAVEDYRRSNINADTFNILSDSILQVQNLHHDCYEFLLKVRDASYDFDTHSKKRGDTLCNLFEEVKYEGMKITKDIDIRPEYKIDNSFKWPDLQINYATEIGCPRQDQQTEKPSVNGGSAKPVADCRSGYFLSTSEARYQSKYMHARENVRLASMAGTAILTSCASCMAYLQQNITFMPATTSAVAIPAAVAFAVEMGISYYEQEKRRQEIKELDEFVKEAENRIEAAFARVIKPDEFYKKRLAFCLEREHEYEQLKERSILAIQAKDHITKINNFFKKADTSIAWYNDLFLYATNGPAGSRLIDEMAKAKIAERREQLYSMLDNSKASLFLATSKGAIQKLQSQIASSCLMGTTKPEKLRNFRTAVRKFRSSCDAQAHLAKVSTDYLTYEDGRQSDVRCYYSGFEPAEKILVRLNSDASLSLTVLQGDKQVARAERVTSETVSKNELFCVSDSQFEFGLPSQIRIKPDTIALNYAVDVNGIKPEDFRSYMAIVKKLNDSARAAIAACGKMLGTTVPEQPENSCISGI